MRILTITNKSPVEITTIASEQCYNTIGKHSERERQYVAAVVRSGHTSVMEHWFCAFELEDGDEFPLEDIVGLANKPGVVVCKTKFLVNWRHIHELGNNMIIQELKDTLRNQGIDPWT